MAMQIREAETVDMNIQQGFSVTQTADGALQEVANILQRVRELSVQASNGTFDELNDRGALQKEISSLLKEVSRVTETADYNNIKLFDGEIEKIISDTTITISPTIWGNLKLTLNDSTNSLVGSSIQVYESVTTQPGTSVNYPTAVENGAGITQTVAGTNEKNAEYELTIPELTHNSSFKFIDSLGSYIYIYMYDSAQLNPPGKTPSMSSHNSFNIDGKTKADIEAYIKARMGRYLNVSSDGEKISFMYPTNQTHSISVSSGGGTASYYESGASSSRVFGVSSYLNMEPASIDIDFSSYFAGGQT